MSNEKKPQAQQAVESSADSKTDTKTDSNTVASTPVDSVTPPSANITHQGKPAMTEKTASGGKGLSIFATLISLAALGGSGYVFYQSELAERGAQNQVLVGVNEIGSNVKVLAERMNQLQREQTELSNTSVTESELKTSVLEITSKTELALNELTQTQTRLNDALEKLAQSSQISNDQLAIDEVSQLLKLANNSAVFAGDKASALSAMRLADSQLKQLSDPRYAVVRRSLSQEIETLEAIQTVDVASVTAALHALAKRVPDLPLENEPPVVERVAVVDAPAEEPFSFTSELKKLWAMMVNSVSIKRVDQPPKPLLAPEQRFFLDRNIQLKLNTAELALMQQRPAIYERSIDEALTWLLDYYDPRDEGVKDVANRLRELKQQEMVIELPSIAKSYDLLQQIQGGN